MSTEGAAGAQSVASIKLRRVVDLPGPKALPLIGNGLQLDSSRLHLILEGWAREHGSIYRVMFGPRPVIVIGDLAAMQPMLLERPDRYRRVSTVEPVLRELGAAGLFSAEGSAWKRQRKLVMPAFSMKQQRDLFPAIALITERLRQYWAKSAQRNGVVDARLDLMRYTVDVTSHVVFGRDLNTIDGAHSALQEHLNRLFHTVNLRVNALLPYWRYFKLPSDRAVDRSLRYVQSMIGEIVTTTRRELAADKARADNPKTLLEAMIVAQDEENPAERFSDEDVSGNVLTLLLAGEDTTSNTLSWVLHYMAHDPVVQERLHAEAREVFGEHQVAARYEDVAKLKYAVAVTHETLRMRSAAPLLFYETIQDEMVGDIALPAGSWIFTLARYCGLDAAHFSDPHTFNPDRWTAPQTQPASPVASAAVHNARAALAFGTGPRSCPGRSLALFECAMVISMVARNFRVEAVSGRDEVEERYDFTMHPSGLKVRFVAR